MKRYLSFHGRLGMALVITLVFVVLITVLIVGMTISMRTDRMAASSHLERIRAKLLSESGIDQVTATLNKHIVEVKYRKFDPQAWDDAKQVYGKEIVTERNWITKPGELYVGAPDDDTATPAIDERRVIQPDPNTRLDLRTQPIPLHSGTAGTNTDPDHIYDPPNLNITTLYDPNTHLISDGDSFAPGSPAPQMRVAWIYVRKYPDRPPFDATAMVPDRQSADAKMNPIVGRYAYWTDDECSKINYNSAWGRGSDNERLDYNSPTRIDLTALPGVNYTVANALRSYLTGGPLMSLPIHLFNSPEDARRIGSTGNPTDMQLRDILVRNKFELTHFNHDSGTNFFGDDRWLLTTNRNLVPHVVEKDANGNVVLDANGKPKIKYLRKFFDILRDDLPPDSDELDPGNMFHIETNGYDFTCGYKDGSQSLSAVNPATGKQRNYGPPAPWSTVNRRCKLDVVFRELVAHLSRTDWPSSAGSSFKEKYFPGISDYNPLANETASKHSRLSQIAINIIAYVCAKESMAKKRGKVYSASASPRDWPYPTADTDMGVIGKDRTDNAENPWGLTGTMGFRYMADAGYPAQAIFYGYNTLPMGTSPVFEANARLPMITEMGMCMEKNPVILKCPANTGQLPAIPPGEYSAVNGLPLSKSTQPFKPNGPIKENFSQKYKVTLKVELYLPDKYGIGEIQSDGTFIPGINLVPDPKANPDAGSLGWFLYFAEGRRNYYGTPAVNQYFAGVPDDNDRLYYAPPDGKGPRLVTMRDYMPLLRICAGDIVGQDGTWLKPGKRVVITKTLWRNAPPVAAGTPLRPNIAMQTGLILSRSSPDYAFNPTYNQYNYLQGMVQRTLPGDADNRECAHFAYGFKRPQRTPVFYKINVVDPSGTAIPGADVIASPDEMHSIEVDDPRTGVSPAMWVRNDGAQANPPKPPNTFGNPNSISTVNTFGSINATLPKPDRTQAKRFSDASLYMPPPAGQKITYPDGTVDDNTLGRVTSIGELGYVFTGADPLAGCQTAALTSGTPTTLIPGITDKNYNVPWRSLYLQANDDPIPAPLPDWVFMDLFEVPQINSNERVRNMPSDKLETTDSISDPTSPWYTSFGSNLRGKLNVNTHPEPFDTSRKAGLRALLVGARPTAAGAPLTPSQAAILADSIYERDYGTKGTKYGQEKVFDTPGEICEIKGIADTGEESEQLVRELGSLTASRGEVFTVYTVGQALKETPDGKLTIAAEQRQHAIVERYRDYNGTLSDLSDDVIKLRTVYCRNLYP